MSKKRCTGDDANCNNNNSFKTIRTDYDILFEILNKTDKLELVSASSLTGFIFTPLKI